MVGGVVYTTAGLRRAAIAADAATGELLWMHRLDEGERAENAPRRRSGRGLAYRDDGGDGQIFYVTPGYRLIGLNAKTGARLADFGDDGIVDLMQNMDQDIDPLAGEIGLHATPLVAGDTVVVGAAHVPGSAPRSMRNTKGYVRGFDATTGVRKWIFHTIPGADEYGNDSWLNDSWRYTGNTGVWGQISADLELGIVYLPTEMPTNDYYGGHRHGDNLFSDSIVAVDIDTGERLWHLQAIHHDVWDWDFPCAPVLVDVEIDGVERKLLVQPSKQSWLYVLDRVTGEPIWPIEEREMPPSDVPGELLSRTQPFPTHPPAYDRQGVSIDDLIDFTPELRAEAEALVSNFRIGPIFTPPVVAETDGPYGTLMLPSTGGGATWPGGSVDPETDIFYQYSSTQVVSLGLVHDPERSDMDFIRGNPPGVPAPRRALNIRGLPLIKPPWGAHQRDRPGDGRHPVADRARRDAGQRAQPPRPRGHRHPPHGPRGTRRHAGHEDAADRGRDGYVHDAVGRGGRDAAGLRQGDGRGGRRGLHAGAGVRRRADDLPARGPAVHRHGDRRRPLPGRADRVPTARVGVCAGNGTDSYRSRIPGPQAPDRLEVPAVAGEQRQVVRDGRGGNQGIRGGDAGFASDAAGALRHVTVHGKFAKGIEEALHERRADGAGQQLAARDDRIMEPVPPGFQLPGAPQMVDEDVRIDQQTGHRSMAALQPLRAQRPFPAVRSLGVRRGAERALQRGGRIDGGRLDIQIDRFANDRGEAQAARAGNLVESPSLPRLQVDLGARGRHTAQYTAHACRRAARPAGRRRATIILSARATGTGTHGR